MKESVAFLDMEFGHIYGTKKLIYYPIDVGIIIYDPKTEKIVEKFSKMIKKDIEIERWRNNTNKLMMTIQPALVKLDNMIHTDYEKDYDENYIIEMEEIPGLLKIAESGYKELGSYLKMIKAKYNIQQCYVYGGKKDILCINRSGCPVIEKNMHDVQDKIKKLLNMDNRLSLDRACYALNITINSKKIKSDNFEYDLPVNKQGKLKNHNAIGDAGRILLLYKELKKSDKDVREKIRQYFRICKAYREEEGKLGNNI